MQGKRTGLVVPEVELPEDLPELYRAMVADLAAVRAFLDAERGR